MHYHNKQSSKQTCFLAFVATKVCTGIFGHAVRVGHQTVEKVLHHVGQTLLCLVGYHDPQQTYGAHQELDLPFRNLLKSDKSQNPTLAPQLAIFFATIGMWTLI
jgi:hypothetical protein